MDPKIRDAVGLLRHRIISPVLMESGREQMEYFRKLSVQPFEVPGQGQKLFKVSTMKGWLYRYRKHGFPALLPKQRHDQGQFRSITPGVRDALVALREENLDLSVVKFRERAVKRELMGEKPVCLATLTRFLKSEGLYSKKTPHPRKRFEMDRFGQLWTCDFMHGPQVIEKPGSLRKRKAILLAIIDDHSRLIVGAKFGVQEDCLPLERVFQDAILSYGLPDRLYCDNGASFSSDYLSQVCAHLGIGLVHSKPYDSPSRGKIERYFRTVRESFLVDVPAEPLLILSELNEKFFTWLRDGYHHRIHAGIDARPIDRYQLSVTQYPRRRIEEERLAEFFMARLTRQVKNDATISVNSIIYELPARLIKTKVELRFSQERPGELYLYEQDLRVSRVLPVDVRVNGKTYRPLPKDSVIPFHQIQKDSDSKITKNNERTPS